VTRAEESEEAVSGADGLVPVALGIEIGGTKLQSAVVAADGRVLLRRSDRVDPAGGADGIRTVLAAQIAGIVDDAAGNRLAIRAIGIGFPERVNIAWDAEAFRLALAWKGSFIDARRHWSGRGEGFQPPMGDAVFTPDAGPCVANLPAPDAPWPAEPVRKRGGRFGGYALDDKGRPTFRWSLPAEKIAVRDSRGELDFLDLARGGFHVRGLLLLLVNVFTEIHNAAHRRRRIRRNLDEIEPNLKRETDRFLRVDDAELTPFG
jgi:hypothetical protein